MLAPCVGSVQPPSARSSLHVAGKDPMVKPVLLKSTHADMDMAVDEVREA